MEYTYDKEVNLEKISSEISDNAILGSAFLNIRTIGSTLVVVMSSGLSQSEKNELDQVISSHTVELSADQIAESKLLAARSFGERTIFDFAKENIMLGITQLGLTSHVRKTTREVLNALETGSLYDAIGEIKIVDPVDLDDTILTEDRLLKYRNRIESFLGVPLASTWNE